MRVPDHVAKTPRCIIIAGPNGAGKTTLAREFLPKDTEIVHFVNADAIAAGLSALKPEIVAIAAARIFLVELDRLATSRTSFAFETTLGGHAYVKRLEVERLRLPDRDRVSLDQFPATRSEADCSTSQTGWPRCCAPRCAETLRPKLGELRANLSIIGGCLVGV